MIIQTSNKHFYLLSLAFAIFIISNQVCGANGKHNTDDGT